MLLPRSPKMPATESSYWSALVGIFSEEWKQLVEEVVGEFEQLILEAEIPVIGALEGNARGAGLLLSQYCDVCVYNANGIYSASGLESSSLLTQRAAALFAQRFGNTVGRQILLSGKEYSGAELQQWVGSLLVAESGQVSATAMRVAESWAKLPAGHTGGLEETQRVAPARENPQSRRFAGYRVEGGYRRAAGGADCYFVGIESGDCHGAPGWDCRGEDGRPGSEEHVFREADRRTHRGFPNILRKRRDTRWWS